MEFNQIIIWIGLATCSSVLSSSLSHYVPGVLHEGDRFEIRTVAVEKRLRPTDSLQLCTTQNKKVHFVGGTAQSALRANNPDALAFTISKVTGGTNHSEVLSGDEVYIRVKHDGFFLAHCGTSVCPGYSWAGSKVFTIDPIYFNQHPDKYKWRIWHLNMDSSLHNEGTPVHHGDAIQFQSMPPHNGWMELCNGETIDGYSGNSVWTIDDVNNDGAESSVRGLNQVFIPEIIDGECSTVVGSRLSCGSVGREECHNRGCCYDSATDVDPACFYAPSGPIHRRLPRITYKHSNTTSLKILGLELTDGDMTTCFPLEIMAYSSVWFDLPGYGSDSFTLEIVMPSYGLCGYFYPMVGASATQGGNEFKECVRHDESYDSHMSKCIYACTCSYGNCNSFTVNFYSESDHIKVKEHKVCEMMIKI